MATVAKRRFIRADGPDKVTGTGRYTADLNLTGMLHAKFRFAGVSHGRITRLDTSKAEALPGVFAVATHTDVPDVLLRRLSCRIAPVLQGVRALRGRHRRRGRRDHARDRPAGGRPDRGRLREAAGRQRPRGRAGRPDAQLVHDDWASYGRTRHRCATATSPRTRRSSRATSSGHGRRRRRRQEPLRGRRLARRADRAARDRRPVEGDHVTIWSSTQVPFAARAGVAETLELPASKVRIIVPLLGGGFGGKCGFHFEAHVAALARKAARPVRLVFSRREEFLAAGPAPRGDGHRDRDGREARRHDHCAPRLPDHRQRRLHRRRGVLLGARRDARAGPYKIPNAQSTRTSSTRTTSRPARCARPPRRRRAGRWSSTWTRSRRRIGIDPVEFRRRNLHRRPATRARRGQEYVRDRRCRSASTTRGREGRLRAAVAGRRGDRRRESAGGRRSRAPRART